MGNLLETDEHMKEWACSRCTFVNDRYATKCDMCENGRIINIPIKQINLSFDEFSISVSYSSSIQLQNVIDQIEQHINTAFYPKIYHVVRIDRRSFIEESFLFKSDNDGSITDKWNDICSKAITEYSISDIIKKGLHVTMHNKITHNVNQNCITCKYMLNDVNDVKNDDEIVDEHKINHKKLNRDPLNCPIYKSMKIKYEFTENGLNHLNEFVHFKNEFNEKPKCRHYQKCNSFIRLSNGGNRLDDRCHMKLFNHPPRNDRQIELSKNINSFVYNDNKRYCQIIYDADHLFIAGAFNKKLKEHGEQLRVKYNRSVGNNGWINALIEEVIKNGYKYDLCSECGSNDNCQHDNYSILLIVDEKLNHIRHQQMDSPLNKGQMLALILYTGCDCNYDLCATQRNGDYEKWKWFDMCLFTAIEALSKRETGSYKVYSGLNAVKLDKKKIECGYFSTYTSSSWSKQVAEHFMGGNEGMMIHIDEKYRGNEFVKCCNVSWISKFPDECEILIARSGAKNLPGFLNIKDRYQNGYCLSVLDEQNGVQTVSLTFNEERRIDAL